MGSRGGEGPGNSEGRKASEGSKQDTGLHTESLGVNWEAVRAWPRPTCFFVLSVLEQGLAICPRGGLNLWQSSCLSLPSAGIKMCATTLGFILLFFLISPAPTRKEELWERPAGASTDAWYSDTRPKEAPLGDSYLRPEEENTAGYMKGNRLGTQPSWLKLQQAKEKSAAPERSVRVSPQAPEEGQEADGRPIWTTPGDAGGRGLLDPRRAASA